MERLLKLMLVVAVVCLACGTARAAPVFQAAVGAAAVSIQSDQGFPSDFELGGNASASLSPHISAVGGIGYGVAHGYVRVPVGVRLTATDVDDPNLAIGLGLQYQFSSDTSLRPQEWRPDFAVGWKPYPKKWNRIGLGLGGSWGVDSHAAAGVLSVQYHVDTP